MSMACTRSKSDNNTHDSTPIKEIRDEKLEEVRELNLLQKIEDSDMNPGSQLIEIKKYYSQNMTEEFFLNLSRTQDINGRRALRRFHLILIKEYNGNEDLRSEYSELAYKYYNQILSICNGDLSSCTMVSLYQKAPYAGDVFLMAERLIEADKKDQYMNFVSGMSRSGKSVEVLKKKLDHLISQLDSGSQVDQGVLKKILNLITYLTAKSIEFDQAAIEKIVRSIDSERLSTPLRLSLEKFIMLTIPDENLSHKKILNDYIKRSVKNSNLYKFMNEKTRSGLIKWKDKSHFVKKSQNNFILYYSLLGLLSPSYSGNLHEKVLKIYMKRESGKNDLLALAEGYIFKRVVSDVYKSHEVIGQILQQKKREFRKIEAFLVDFFPLADSEMAEILV